MSGQWIRLFFEPLDVLLFRDHRPFDAGLHTRARKRMPFPTTFVGCVRTALFRLLGADFSRNGKGEFFGITDPWAQTFLGGATEPVGFRFQGPFVARYGEPQGPAFRGEINVFYPPPADLRRGRASGGQVVRLGFEKPPDGEGALRMGRYRWRNGSMQPMESHRCSPWLGEDKTEKNEVLQGFLTHEGAKWWRDGGDIDQWDDGRFFVEETQVFQTEERVGIARDETLTVVEGLFYAAQMIRFANGAGFVCALEVTSDEQTNLVRRLDGRVVPLGGKNRRVRISVLEQPGMVIPDEWTHEPERRDGELRGKKAWLITPAMGTVDTVAEAVGLLCGGAAVERTTPAGGFDLAHGAPKPLWMTVGAGSVLALNGGGGGREIAAQQLNGPTPAGLERYGDSGKLGYGWAIWEA